MIGVSTHIVIFALAIVNNNPFRQRERRQTIRGRDGRFVPTLSRSNQQLASRDNDMLSSVVASAVTAAVSSVRTASVNSLATEMTTHNEPLGNMEEEMVEMETTL